MSVSAKSAGLVRRYISTKLFVALLCAQRTNAPARAVRSRLRRVAADTSAIVAEKKERRKSSKGN